jgi:glycosyltransferase involved in cell wall biosynthesis
MKKNILFVMNNLNCGGAEKALISLLETIDYSLYNIDLFLFKHDGLFLEKIPQTVNLLEEPFEYRYFDMSIKKAILDLLKRGRLGLIFPRICAGYLFKLEKNRAVSEQRSWKYLSKSISVINKKYDAAIGFLEKNPIYFCIEKVVADKKIGFIHTDYNKLGMDSEIDAKYFRKLDHIVSVSEECVNILKQRFPLLNRKIKLMHNIVSPHLIKKLSLEEIKIQHKGITIVTVGRLHHLKGFDLAINACEMVVKKGYALTWYIVGEGEERTKLEQLIKEKNLQEIFILLGAKENPYPYIKGADLYVHPSRFEGKSIAIDEAKILNKPIVVTNFNTAKDQIIHEKNGLIVETNAKSIAEGIVTLIRDKELRNKFILNLSNEKLGTEAEIGKLYELFNKT